MKESDVKQPLPLEEKNFRRFFQTFLLVALLPLWGLFFLNWLVDPQGYMETPLIRGFNDIKPFKNLTTRDYKSLKVRRDSYQAVVVGNSREGDAFDPDTPALARWRTFNAALLNGSVYELSELLSNASAHKGMELVLWGLDFESFRVNPVWRGKQTNSPMNFPPWLFYLNHNISVGTTRQSWRTMTASRAGRPMQTYGHTNGYFGPASGNVKNHDYWKAFKGRVRHDTCHKNMFGNFKYEPKALAPMEEVLTHLKKQDVRIILFFAPIHAIHVEVMARWGLLESYRQWQRNTTQLVERLNDQVTGPQPIQIYDFSGYNSITTEPLPNSDAPMRWYWESVHYRKELGDLILERVLAKPGEQLQVPPDFGVPVNVSMLDKRLLNEEKERAIFLDTFASVLKILFPADLCAGISQ